MRVNRSCLSHSNSQNNINISTSSQTFLPYLNVSFSDDFPTCSHDLISLKKKLNRINSLINEIKISHCKLKLEQEENKNIIKEAIISSRTTQNPIDIKMNKDDNTNQEKSTLPSFSYNKLKEKKNIYVLKNEILMNQRMIKEKDNEINSLLIESKVTKLIEKNNKLLDTMNKIQVLTDKNKELESSLIPMREQSKSSLQSQVQYYKSINIVLKNEECTVKESYGLRKGENSERIKAIAVQEEKYNNMKFKFNSYKQSENKKNTEAKQLQDKIDKVPEIKKFLVEKEAMIHINNEEISKIKKEIEDKEKIINGLIEETTKLKDIMIMNEKAKKREIAKDKEAYTEIKNQIENIEKKIIPIKNDNHFIGVDIEKINIILSKKNGDKMKKAKEKMKVFEVDQTYEYEFIGKPKPKIRKTKCMIIEEENHTEPNNKEQNQIVNQHNKDRLTVPVINIIPKTNPPTPKHQQIDHSNSNK